MSGAWQEEDEAATAAYEAALPRSAEEARRLGARRYRTGLPCSRGHRTWRSALNSTCAACARDAARARYRAAHPRSRRYVP